MTARVNSPAAQAVRAGRAYERAMAQALRSLCDDALLDAVEAQPREPTLGFIPDFRFRSRGRLFRVLVTSSTVVRASDAKFWESLGECERLGAHFPGDRALLVLCGPRAGWKRYMPKTLARRAACFLDALDVPLDALPGALDAGLRALLTSPRSCRAARNAARSRSARHDIACDGALAAPTHAYRLLRLVLLLDDETRRTLLRAAALGEVETLVSLAATDPVLNAVPPALLDPPSRPSDRGLPRARQVPDPRTQVAIAPWLVAAARQIAPSVIDRAEALIEKARPGARERARRSLIERPQALEGEAAALFDALRALRRQETSAPGMRDLRARCAAHFLKTPGNFAPVAEALGLAPNRLVSDADRRHRERQGRHLFYPPNCRPWLALSDLQAQALARSLCEALMRAEGGDPPQAARRRLHRAWEAWYKDPISNPLSALIALSLRAAGLDFEGFPEKPRGVITATGICEEAWASSRAGGAQFAFCVRQGEARAWIKTVCAYQETGHRVKELWAKLPLVRGHESFVAGRDRLFLVIDGDWGGPRRAREALATLSGAVDGVFRAPTLEGPHALTRALRFPS